MLLTRWSLLLHGPLRLAAVLAASFALAGPSCAHPPARLLTLADNGRTLRLRPGQLLRVALPGNPTTGYRWRVVGSPRPQLQLTDSSYQAAPHAPQLVGGGGTQHLVFTARQAGSTKLELAYYRPWEKPAPADQHYQLTVHVR